jgi:hypothetical protein
MDDEWMRAFEIEVSKVGFLLEGLYAMHFSAHGADFSDVDETSDEFCRQAMLPPSIYGPDQDPAYMQQFQELLAHRIAMFFAGVRKRLETTQPED